MASASTPNSSTTRRGDRIRDSKWAIDIARRKHALIDLPHVAAHDERARPVGIEMMRIGEAKALQFENIRESRSHQQPGPRARALDDGVQGEGRPMRKVGDRRGRFGPE